MTCVHVSVYLHLLPAVVMCIVSCDVMHEHQMKCFVVVDGFGFFFFFLVRRKCV